MFTIADVRESNRVAGFHWFDASTMRFFNSRVSSQTYPCADGTCIFVSSERMNADSPRRFTVRRCELDGSITDVSAFQEFDNRESAHRAAWIASGSAFSRGRFAARAAEMRTGAVIA